MFLIFRADLTAHVELQEHETRHARARRLTDGAPISLGDGLGRRVRGQLTSLRTAQFDLTTVETQFEPSRILYSAVPEPSRMEWLLQKGTELGMTAFVPRLGKQVHLTNPVAFFGQERSTIDDAYPGDIIGMINPGTYHIGDILSTGKPPAFPDLPRFAPDMFASLIPTDTSKLKQFKKGIQELAEEGVVQIFSTQDGSVVIGAAGQLQFEEFRFRMEDEYGAPCRLEVMPFECSRWIRPSDANKFSSYDRIVKDEKGRTVVLFKSEYRLKSFLQTNADIPVYDHPPQAD
jgi:hypothetical protein